MNTTTTIRATISVVLATTAALLPMTSSTPAASAAAGSLSPVADSYVDSSAPTRNYGTRTYLKEDGSPTLVGYVKFTVSGHDSVGYAVLRLRALSNHRSGVTVHAVGDNSWGEQSITYQNRPALGAALGSTGQVTSGSWYGVDVSSLITGNGTYTLALTTASGTSVKFGSRESADAPQLVIDTTPPPVSTSFSLERIGDSYRAVSPQTGSTYTGSLKLVGEKAVAELEASGGGTLQFAAGDYDFGSEYFKFDNPLHDITFAGAGMDATVIRNYTSAAADTEPFNFSGTFGVTVRDLAVSAGGPARSTSDALDFDDGNDSTVEDVKITDSRARGIVFDGKNSGWDSAHNTVRGVVITQVDTTGIQFLASTDNLVENCVIANTGTHGIQATKSSTVADQANKKSSRNVIRNNVIDQAGQDGISINSGDDNQLLGNTVTNSSDDTSGRDGIRIMSTDGVSAERNVVSGNTATDNQVTKTQRYGLNLSSSAVVSTTVSGNDFEGNLVAPIRDLGTATSYQ